MSEPEVMENLTSYAARLLRDQTSVAIEKLNGDDAPAFLRELRQEMFVCRDEEHRPRLCGRILIVWPDRLIGAITPTGIEVFKDELVFFVDALRRLLATSYAAPEKYTTSEADLLDQIREQGRGDLTEPSEGAFELIAALGTSIGTNIGNIEQLQGVPALTRIGVN